MPDENPKNEQGTGKALPPNPLSRNIISYLGWLGLISSITLTLVLVSSDFLFHRDQPYNSLVTYLVMPGIIGGSVSIIFLGIFIEWIRRHRREPNMYPTLPTIDLNVGWMRQRLFFGTGMLTVFLGVSAIGVYHSYHYTESTEFCGLVCHTVMEPEYTTYQHSPHSRVGCTECHIGSGADWFVKSKVDGLRQVYAMATNSYRLPIPTPVHNLRPARDTCEQCHMPGKYSGSMIREIWHFSPDQANTPMRYNLLMKIGGGQSRIGGNVGDGIHWHTSTDVVVRYWASDKQRMEIPWVEVSVAGEEPRVFRSASYDGPEPPENEIRVMDCIDCHNRPAHVYKSPRQLVDNSLAEGLLDTSLPYIRRYATEILETPFESTADALAAIDRELRDRYASRMQGPQGRALVEDNIKWLQAIYKDNFFPQHGVDWRVYPNHIGHFEFPGCNRCHGTDHQEVATGAHISNDCSICHDVIEQSEGMATRSAAIFTAPQEFRHPRGLTDVWKDQHCTECHAPTGMPPAPLVGALSKVSSP
jgi:nitrate/TMAO reductase-like tetraheme cytochrome c subunit